MLLNNSLFFSFFLKPPLLPKQHLRDIRDIETQAREIRERLSMEEHHQSPDYSDEDYIDMEVNSQQANIFCHFQTSPAYTSEFEFQMFSGSLVKDTTTSPADELFYKGKLLPLHLPPRLQMVEKLLQNPSTYDNKMSKTDIYEEESYSTPLFTSTANTPVANTPFESCNISPVESCQVSRELHPDEYLYEYLEETRKTSDDQCSKKSWTKKKLKLIKQTNLGSKLKASRAYIKSLFNKSGCADKTSAAALPNLNEAPVSKPEQCGKTPYGQIQKAGYQIPSSTSFKKEDNTENEKGRHRRSFSGAIKRLSSSKFSSSESSSGVSSASSSNNSNGFQEMQFFKKSVISKSEVESPIQAAIAHCKQSQQQFQFQSRKTVSDVGICSLSASRIVHDDQDRPRICRG